MKILRIHKIEDTENCFFLKIKFKNIWGKTFWNTCVKNKKTVDTFYFGSGDYLPVKLWKVVDSFIESEKSFIDVE